MSVRDAADPIEGLAPPLHGESLDGFVSRAVEDMGLTSVRELKLTVGAQPHMACFALAGDEALRALADEIGVAAEPLLARAWHPTADGVLTMNGVRLDSRMVEKRHRRYAPTELGRAPHHRELWSLRILPFCDVTGEILRDRCPRCEERQSWRGVYGPDLCGDCGSPLASADAAIVDAKDLPALRTALGLVHHDPTRRAAARDSLPPRLRGEDPSTVVALLCAVAGWIDPALRDRLQKQLLSRSAPPARVAAAMAAAWRCVEGWPATFLSELDERFAARAERGNAAGHALMDFLAIEGRVRPPEGLRRLVREMRDELSARRDRGCDLDEAAKRTGIAERAIVEARRAGRIASFVAIDAQLPRCVYVREDVDRLREAFRGSLVGERAAHALGIGYRGVEELVAIGMLESVVPAAYVGDRGRLRITRDSMMRLEARLNRVGEATDGSDLVPLDEAMFGIGGRLKPWTATLIGLVEGAYACRVASGPAPLVSRVRIRSADVPDILSGADLFDVSDPRFCATMSKSDAATVLNADVGLAAEALGESSAKGRRDRSVSIDTVLRLSREVASAREIGTVLGCSPYSVTWRAQRLGIDRISPLGWPRSAMPRFVEDEAAT